MAMMTTCPLMLTRSKMAKLTLVIALTRTTALCKPQSSIPLTLHFLQGDIATISSVSILTPFMANIHNTWQVLTTEQEAAAACSISTQTLSTPLTSYWQQNESGDSGVSKYQIQFISWLIYTTIGRIRQ
jgi:hypothetical protein